MPTYREYNTVTAPCVSPIWVCTGIRTLEVQKGTFRLYVVPTGTLDAEGYVQAIIVKMLATRRRLEGEGGECLIHTPPPPIPPRGADRSPCRDLSHP
ncbi:unnamed protein product, partial [Iphiclides podalirius]